MSGLTATIAKEVFFWCAVMPTNARNHCEQYLFTIAYLLSLQMARINQTRLDANNTDAPRQERPKLRENYIVFIFVIENPLKVGILLSRAIVTYYSQDTDFSHPQTRA
jgi:hypothetical protein